MTLSRYIAGTVVTLALTQGLMAQDVKPDSAAAVTDTFVVIKKPETGIRATGTIIDAATNKPLAGINVSVPSFSAAITDEKGRFNIKVPSYKTTLFVNADGFQAKAVPLRGETDVTVNLYEENFDSYYDPATTPTGVRSKNEVTSSVSSINPQGWNNGLETPDNYLQGLANGLTVTRKSGTPNIGSALFMRGMSSLYATNKPLIVVDGMIYDNADFGGSIISNNYNNPMSLIDIKDIDNITVIKDGTSLYGTKGANGVILITTAKAKQLATKIDFGVFYGLNFAPSKLPVMKAEQHRSYLSDMLQTQGFTNQQVAAQPYMTNDPNNANYYRYHAETDWQDEIFQNGKSQNVFLKVTGGDNIAKYALSMGYFKNDGVIRNTDATRYNTRFNADLNLSKKLTANANLSFSYGERNVQNQGNAPKLNPISVALSKSPFMHVHEIDSKGNVSPNLAEVDTLGFSNPATIVQKILGINKVYRFFGSLTFKYQVNNNLSVSSLFGLTNDKVRENFFIPRKGIVKDTLTATTADSRSGSQVKRLFGVYSDTRIAYQKTINRVHDVRAMAGLRYLQQTQEQDYGFGYNSATDELVNVNYGVASLRQVGGDIGKNNWLSTYAAVSYSFDNSIFINADIAVDGSSRFGKQVNNAPTFNGNEYAILPSIGAAWLISSERFMHNIPIISFLKLRASYSHTGNDDIGNFTARQYYVSQNLLGMQGLVRGNIANPHLQWELNKKGNIGLDLGLLSDRIRISVDAYRNSTRDMIIMEDAPAASGFNYVTSNSGGMKTLGIEGNVQVRVINHSSLKLDVGAGITAYKNKITRLPNGPILTQFAGATIITETGKAANLFYGHKTNGVYSTDAEAAADGYSIRRADGTLAAFKGGDIRFTDLNNDHIIDDKDRQVIGNPNPDFTGSFTVGLSWKRFTLDALFTFTCGNDAYNYQRQQLESGATYSNQLESMGNRWRGQGQVTNMPKATWNDPMGNSRFSDRWIEDGSYLRLRSLSISYNLKVKPGFLKYVTVYATATNLFTVSKYLGYDPEFSATESVLGQGVDVGLEPQYRSTQAGVRIGL
ncbi:MAG: SusC/RagA family TonB-linked outer membrane protein [Chitinophagaceae bacterium]